eukprot:3528362-Amphidinium_carterae.2
MHRSRQRRAPETSLAMSKACIGKQGYNQALSFEPKPSLTLERRWEVGAIPVEGMNFLVTVLLWHAVKEEDAFWIFVSMMQSYGLRCMYEPPDMCGLKMRSSTMSQLLHQEMPDLSGGQSVHSLPPRLRLYVLFRSSGLLLFKQCACVGWFLDTERARQHPSGTPLRLLGPLLRGVWGTSWHRGPKTPSALSKPS